MTLTLLLDLDDTLLTNNIESFQTAYLRALGKHLSRFVEPKKMIDRLLYATQKMIDNQDPGHTLEEVFDTSFYAALGLTKDDLRPVIENFYNTVFPTLQPLTSPKDEARLLIDLAEDHGWNIVVATNPIFPRTAIVQRLEWAGFPLDKYKFNLITTYEDFHFAKPNPAYYAEIMSCFGWPAGPAIMVGNDLEMDIRPAQHIGLSAFLLAAPDQPKIQEGKSDAPIWQGTLNDLTDQLPFLEVRAAKTDHLTPEALLAILRSTPAALLTLAKSVPESRWGAQPAPSEWGFTEILCHLRDVDIEVNLPRLQKVLSEENPFLPGIDSDPWAEDRHYLLQDGFEALQAFVGTRLKLISLLQGLSSMEWGRMARHAIFGPTSLIELVSFTVTHDQNHMNQWANLVYRPGDWYNPR